MESRDHIQQWQGDAYLVSNTGNEGLDVELCGAALLARSICTLEAASSLLQRSTLTQCGVLDIVKVTFQAFACLEWNVRGEGRRERGRERRGEEGGGEEGGDE